MRIGIVTLGCDKNTVDNEYIAGLLEKHGMTAEAADEIPDTQEFDAVIINTCGFIESARTQSVRTILQWIQHKDDLREQGYTMRVFVAGCLTQRYRESLIQELPEVDGFLGVGEFHRVLDLVRSPEGTVASRNLISDPPHVQIHEALPRKKLQGPMHSAYLKISDGCSHNCSFCAIPSFKGRLHSVPREILLAEARMLIARGVREINIVAQDTSDYGHDLYGAEYGTPELLNDLAALPGDFWLRLFYYYPGGLTEHFLEVFAGNPKIARYLDLPLQHLHKDVLKRMKRPYADVNTFTAIARLRTAVPDIAIRTTFIVGFPAETEDEFQYLCDGVRKLRFDRVGAFAYSSEEGTACLSIRPKVPSRTKQSRLKKLMTLQSSISAELNLAKVGKQTRVLVDGRFTDGRYVARSQSDAPEVDGLVLIDATEELQIGSFVDVTITGSDTYDLFARV